ncbi:unnamed protein product [Rotaria sp. Silwood1]|nr:unnamed protein product [Rotaria sp. Silwood1]CAF1631789.1 unnamed protein product [Rotaria sp. Silwood1]CAF3806202.1 unnamed protein product [Rotaria sp. Silwood1]CAF4817843.1 unnamed protein product [Rotaria sp. Silwood1]
MACRLSLYTCWFPRTLLCQKFFLRSSFSTIPKPDTISQSHRSASRFSVKIARFLFSKERLKQSASLSTHAHYTKTESSGDIHELARSFILSLEPVFLETGLPYIGFGFVDNFVMLIAGETIEAFFGVAFCLSTMAAAALGNAVSDVMGIGLADRIERTCGRFLGTFGVKPPKLTADQWGQRSVQITQLMSKVICIFVGCLLGMCPLLFRDTSTNKNKSTNKDEK